MSAPVSLDQWLPDPHVRTRHRRSAQAGPDSLWDAAQSVRVRDTRRLERIVRWRIPGTPPDQRYADLFRTYPFALLGEGERWTASGLCGRIWTLSRDYPRIDGLDDFLAWHEPGTVRVLLAHWIDDSGDTPALVSEARVQAVDRRARLRLRALWQVVGSFERLIGGEALRVAAGRASG